jgi:hypothetical protein
MKLGNNFQLNSLLWPLAVGLGLIAGSLTPRPAAALDPVAQTPVAGPWQRANAEETAQIWQFILQSPLGIAALNQLAIEGFINPLCEKTLYTHAEYGSFQSLMQVECPAPGGVSTARAYREMRVTLSRFEDTIIDFEVERLYEEY